MTIQTEKSFLLAKRGRNSNALRSGKASVGLSEARAFTLVEVLVVVALLIIAGVAAIPLISGAGSVSVQAAADMVAADLEYAKSMAVSRGQSYSVLFDIADETYSVRDQSGTVIGHPVKQGFDYVVDFANDSRFAGLDIGSVNFDSTTEVKFDYLGSPEAADGTDLVNSGVVTLAHGAMTGTVSIEPVTGVITTSD